MTARGVSTVRSLSRRVAKQLWRRPGAAHAGRELTFRGDYACWSDARAHATGYDAPEILGRTRDALLRVKHGDAVFERDSVLLDKPEYPLPLLAGLLRARLMDGCLTVVDFGGSLGSTFFQCRPFLHAAGECVEWLVVEQPAHVACGRTHFEDDTLRFHETVEECLDRRPNVLLLSSVLQYLPEPYSTLEQLLRHQIQHVILDRTAFLHSDRDRLTVQTVPASIYPATYPAWFLSETKLRAACAAAGYTCLADFPGADRISPDDEPAYFKGFIYEKPRG